MAPRGAGWLPVDSVQCAVDYSAGWDLPESVAVYAAREMRVAVAVWEVLQALAVLGCEIFSDCDEVKCFLDHCWFPLIASQRNEHLFTTRCTISDQGFRLQVVL